MPIVSKGTVFQMDVAGSLAAISEVLSIDLKGGKSNTFDYTNLSQSGSGEARLATGFTTPPDVNIQMFWLPTNSGHQAMTDELTTPNTTAAGQLDAKIIFSDTTEIPFKIAGIEVGLTWAMNDGVKGDVGFTLNGNPTWPT